VADPVAFYSVWHRPRHSWDAWTRLAGDHPTKAAALAAAELRAQEGEKEYAVMRGAAPPAAGRYRTREMRPPGR
jgi:hypothetical protein